MITDAYRTADCRVRAVVKRVLTDATASTAFERVVGD